MIAKVFHAKKPNFGYSKLGPNPVWPVEYVHVANVELDPAQAGDVQKVFYLTNTIDEPWWLGPKIALLVKPSVRSTSVGDVIQMPNDKCYQVEMVGWKEIGQPEAQPELT